MAIIFEINSIMNCFSIIFLKTCVHFDLIKTTLGKQHLLLMYSLYVHISKESIQLREDFLNYQ